MPAALGEGEVEGCFQAADLSSYPHVAELGREFSGVKSVPRPGGYVSIGWDGMGTGP